MDQGLSVVGVGLAAATPGCVSNAGSRAPAQTHCVRICVLARCWAACVHKTGTSARPVSPLPRSSGPSLPLRVAHLPERVEVKCFPNVFDHGCPCWRASPQVRFHRARLGDARPGAPGGLSFPGPRWCSQPPAQLHPGGACLSEGREDRPYQTRPDASPDPAA